MTEYPRYLTAGDQGLVVEFGDTIDAAVNRRVRDLFLALHAASMDPGTGDPASAGLGGDAGREKRTWDPALAGLDVAGRRLPGILDLLPTYRSLLITYDPLAIAPKELRAAIEEIEEGLSAAPAAAPRVLEVPTVYGGAFGPDLPFVASHNNLGEDEVVRIHSGTDYLVYMMGFSPGFPYLGGMSERIATPRLKTPRTTIPAGSVGIAQTQTGIYPVESPGGWQLIGRTPIALFDALRTPPVLVEAGDYIRFVPISEERYAELADLAIQSD